jgi:ABC-type multidrug transport system ATPase subunit
MTTSPRPTGRVGLEAIGLAKSYGGVSVFRDFDLVVPDGCFTFLRGRNGSGKSTLLGCLAGARPLDAGEVSVYGDRSDPSSAAHWRSVYSILDEFPWLPDLSVRDHLNLLRGSAAAVTAALTAFEAAGLEDRLPRSLSSGQRQRCALATAMLRDWQVLILDEPERHLDHQGVILLAQRLGELLRPGRCIVLSSHSSQLLAALPESAGGPVIDLDVVAGTGGKA